MRILAFFRIGARRCIYHTRQTYLADAIVQILTLAVKALEAAADVVAHFRRRDTTRATNPTTRTNVLGIARKLVRAQRVGPAPVTVALLALGSREAVVTRRWFAVLSPLAAPTNDCFARVVLALTIGAVPDTAEKQTAILVADQFTQMCVLIKLTRHAARSLVWCRVDVITAALLWATSSDSTERVSTAKLFAHSRVWRLETLVKVVVVFNSGLAFHWSVTTTAAIAVAAAAASATFIFLGTTQARAAKLVANTLHSQCGAIARIAPTFEFALLALIHLVAGASVATNTAAARTVLATHSLALKHAAQTEARLRVAHHLLGRLASLLVFVAATTVVVTDVKRWSGTLRL